MLQNLFPTARKQVIDGTCVRLEPLDADAHAEDLFVASQVPDREDRFRYLPVAPPEDLAAMRAWVEAAEASDDPQFFAVVDTASGRAVGRQALMRIDSANGVAEIGHIYWGPAMARSAKATEALYLVMRHVFETLGYRRFEWKCDNLNAPSKAAALRFGFTAEGVFRQHLIVKGQNRDTAWFSIIDSEWPALQAAYETWLAPDNFDADGRQRIALSALTAAAQSSVSV